MVLDSSVLVQLIFAEPGHAETIERLLQAEVRLVGSPTLVEVGLVVGNLGLWPVAARGARSPNPSFDPSLCAADISGRRVATALFSDQRQGPGPPSPDAYQ